MSKTALTGYNVALQRGAVGLARSMMRRNNAGRNQFYRSPGTYNRLGARSRQRNWRSRTLQNQRRRKSKVGNGVTDHHDSRLIYRKSTMPRFQKRKWKAFRNKVKAVSEKDLGTLQFLFNQTYEVLNQAAGAHAMANFMIYPLKSASTNLNDLNTIATTMANADNTVAKGLVIDPSTKLLFQSAVMDITVRNASTYNGTYDSTARMEVDVYDMSCRHSGEETGTTYADLIAMLAQNKVQLKPVGGGATEIDFNTRGSTPFDFSYALSRFGIKIWSKKKYQLSNQDAFTYQVRDPKRRVTTFREIANQDGWNMPGWTRCILIIGKMLPGLVPGDITGGFYQERLQVGATRKYVLKVENYTEDRTAYFNA